MPLDERFLADVRDLLHRLYDYPYLQDHPLLEQLLPEKQSAARERVRALRAIVFEAIAELKPRQGVSFRSEAARTYNLLNLRYVEGSSIEDVARELALSERQLHRHLRKAEEDLATVLWARRPRPPVAARAVPEPGRTALVLQEVQRLGPEAEPISVHELLEGALAAVSRLAERRRVQLQAAVLREPMVVDTDRILARHALVNALSYAVQQAEPGSIVSLAANAMDAEVRVQIRHRPGGSASGANVTPVAAQELVKSLGGEWAMKMGSAGLRTITLTLGSRAQTSVLVIDNHEGLLELFRRYLAGEGYLLLGARDGPEGLRLAEQEEPDVIVLDVMMPRNDGFEVLQWLQTRERTRQIPVIICSVLDDPELALSLGATAFLAKPVDPEQLLAALARCRGDTPSRPHPTAPADT